MARKTRTARVQPTTEKFTHEVEKLSPRNANQQRAFDSLRNNTLTVLTGPPGTAKTLLSVYVAYELLNAREIDKIYYCKPVVKVDGEVGLGFLPGELNEKMYPHIAPVVDCLNVFMSEGKAKYLIDKKIIEYLPIEHLRGRSLNRCFVIADEMQNATPSTVLTILTRMGAHSKISLIGDVVQRDLSSRFGKDGLSDATRRLAGVSDVGHIEFEFKDIVRSAFVKNVIYRYADLYA
jgi:phosphate starvation-inducible PhoH-like protein